MSQQKDIVVQLREWKVAADGTGFGSLLGIFNEAADEIDDLRFQLEGIKGELENALSRERTLLEEQEDCRIGNDNLEAEIARLRAERDEARWRLCKVVGDNRDVWGCEIAKENGWDYLATEAKP